LCLLFYKSILMFFVYNVENSVFFVIFCYFIECFSSIWYNKTESVVKLMPGIKFVALGGGQHIGASCYFLQVNGKNILFDCGKGNDEYGFYNPNFDTILCDGQFGVDNLSQIDSVFISHAHFDHIGYLVNLIKKSRNPHVYSTNLTKKICSHLISEENHWEISKLSLDKKLEYDRDIQKVLEHTEAVNYNHRYKVEDDIYFTFYPAGHIPGAAMIYLEIYGTKVLYTGDFSMVSTPLAYSCELPKNISPDVIIVCGTHAKHPNYNPSVDMEKNIISLCRKYTSKNLYCKVKQLTKGIELVQVLRSAMDKKFLPKRKIYVDPNIWELADKLEESGIRIFDGNCSCFKKFKGFWNMPDGIYIGNDYYSRGFDYVENVDFTLHATYENITDLISMYSPRTVFVVHSADDRENKYETKLSNDFPDINIIYAEDDEIFDLTKEGFIYENKAIR